jgi:hypothetical protein
LKWLRRAEPQGEAAEARAARLQTLDQGAPVSIYTVAGEMRHGSMAMVERVYSHLGTIRHRAAVVEYRVEQHVAKLGERLAALRSADSGTTHQWHHGA